MVEADFELAALDSHPAAGLPRHRGGRAGGRRPGRPDQPGRRRGLYVARSPHPLWVTPPMPTTPYAVLSRVVRGSSRE